MRQRTKLIRSGATLIAVIAACITNGQTARVGGESTSRMYDLKCNYLTRPLGIDDEQPIFSWKWTSTDKAISSTKVNSQAPYYFKITVNTDSLALSKDKEGYWNSGFKLLDVAFATYEGKALKPFTRYYWKIQWTKDTTSTGPIRQQASSFETGLQTVSNWQGAWISDDHPKDFKPAGYFRKEFLLNKPIKSARVFIAAGGLYTLEVNGKRLGDRELDPIYTRFDRRILYTTYDATKELRDGGNAIGVVLGNGWYNLQSTAVWGFDKAPWRARPTFCLDLRIVYEDGTVQTVCSGKDWKTKTGPIVFNSIYTAEHQDDRLAMPGWAETDYVDSLWKPVALRDAPTRVITSSEFVPIRKTATLKPVSVQKISDTDYVFNLGQNIAGISEIKLKGEAGTVIRLKHGERLYKNGHVDISNIDVHYRPTDDSDPFQTDIYTLSGKGEETFRPWFNYKGFQYIEVTSNKPVQLTKDNLVAYFMHSDVTPVGTINSSDTVLNKIWAATNQSYLSNLYGYPTDCPQREKNGWTGDAQINIQTGLYNFDGITVYEKWLRDHLDEQQPNGILPSIIPSNGWGYDWGNGPDWTSTIAIIPWNLYMFYGDSSALNSCYPAIKAYVNHITRISPTGLCSWGLGDWVPVKSKTPVEFTSTIYYYTDVMILARAARLFGKDEDASVYEALAEKIKTAFNDKYLNRSTGIYAEGFQTEMSAPIYWDMVPEDAKVLVAANLNKRVISDGYHLDVGLLGSKTILGALSRSGYINTAYRLAAQRTFPSWGWWIVNGATTLYENWNIASANDISLNHIMFGEIGAWLFKGIGGIFPDPKAPGFRHIILKPNMPDGLDHFEAKHTGPFGEIVVHWQKTGKQSKRKSANPDDISDSRDVRLDIQVPAFSSAKLQLPGTFVQVMENGKSIWIANKRKDQATTDHFELEVPAGNYQFLLKRNK